MKHLYLLCVSLVLPTLARAQTTYWPLLRPGLVYQVSQTNSPGDTTHTVRLSSAPTLAGAPDSVYEFNQQTWRVASAATACGALFAARPNRLFGSRVLVGRALAQRGVYVLTTANSAATFTLRLRQPLNQAWPVTASGISGQVTARTLGTVLGQPDSIVTITLSNAQTIRIGKRYGWLQGPAPTDVLRGRAAPRQLVLSALPALGLGTTVLGDWGAFDFQPNDVFLRHQQQIQSNGSMICSESWQRDSVLTRTLSPDGTTRTYTIWTRTLTRNYGAPTAPISLCNNTPGTTFGTPQVYTQEVAQQTPTLLGSCSNSAVPLSPGSASYVIVGAGYQTAAYNSRKIQAMRSGYIRCLNTPQDSLWLGTVPDIGAEFKYAAGLGEVSLMSAGQLSITIRSLLGYRKGSVLPGGAPETWGSLRTFAQILSADNKQLLATTAAFPNPFSESLMLRFEAARGQLITVQLYNALGQQVLTAARVVAVGKAEIALPTAALPAGFYTLHLLREGQTEVMKVAKAQ
jgi:hypothetical protein